MSKFSRTDSFNNITDQDLYIESEEGRKGDHPLEMSNISWASLVEEELSKSMEIEEHSLTLSQSKVDRVEAKKEETEVTADQVVELDLKLLPDPELLKHQGSVTSYLRRAINRHLDRQANREQFEFDLDDFRAKLGWLSTSTRHLGMKIGMKIEVDRNDSGITVASRTIPRSSYQFCSYRHDCDFNYNHQKHKGCYSQHYVYNILYEDLGVISDYLASASSPKELNFHQLKKSIDTASFVINHMCTELTNALFFKKKPIEEIHCERTPHRRRRTRRNRTKPQKPEKTEKAEKTVRY